MKDNILTVKVREATKTGYAVARGGGEIVLIFQCQEARHGEDG